VRHVGRFASSVMLRWQRVVIVTKVFLVGQEDEFDHVEVVLVMDRDGHLVQENVALLSVFLNPSLLSK
jgi:hypothetical protein